MPNPCKCEFSPRSGWQQKGRLFTRIFYTPFEKGTERISVITPSSDGGWSFEVTEYNKDLVHVEKLGTSNGRSYSNSLTKVMSFCDRLSSNIFTHGRDPALIQTTIKL